MANHSPRTHPVRLALCALSLALLACSLNFGGDEGPEPSTPAPGSTGGQVPIVRILDPAPGAVVPRGQPVNITAESDTAASRFQLNVGGHVASTTALPSGQLGPTQAILSWVPEREGTYQLEVIAFDGAVASVPASLQLVVSGTAAGTAPGGACAGRVLVSQLNFRSGPGTGAGQLGQFEVGETVTVLGRNADSSWYQVQRATGQTGWVINNVTWFQVEGACGALPVTG